MADKFLGGSSTRPLLVAAASLTAVVLLFWIWGATRSLPLDSLIRSSRSFSPPERDLKNCSAAAAAASTGDPPPRSRPDKFLGGLLSPDFDEASCVSRYQSSQFWHSNHTPSSYLLRKLRSYEALHKKCGPNSELFNRSLLHLNARTGEGGNSECNYVVWLQAGGLGNRLIALVSAFLYALLNDKVLLLSVPGDLHDTFCEPFPDTSWALPSDFPISNFETHDFYGQSARSYGNLLKNKVISRNSTETASLLPPFLYLHLTHDAGDSDKMFYCEDAQSLLQNFTWIFLRSNQYFAPALFLMPQYDEELSKLFPEKETVFHHLGRYLLHPTNSVWGYVTRYYEAYLANAGDRLGIQVRIFPNAPIKFELMLAQVINCTLKQGILPGTLIDAPANSSSTAMGTKAPKAVLVTSLQTGYFETLRNMYYERATATGEVVGVYQPSHEEKQRTERQGHNAKALAEMYLLSFSDTLVTSAFSTFGYVAQSLGGLRPWIVLRPDDRNNQACRRASSMEPCFHFAPAFDCKAEKNVDKGEVVPHVRHCEDLDFHWGLKLFD